jgi:hypothetical protein
MIASRPAIARILVFLSTVPAIGGCARAIASHDDIVAAVRLVASRGGQIGREDDLPNGEIVLVDLHSTNTTDQDFHEGI